MPCAPEPSARRLARLARTRAFRAYTRLRSNRPPGPADALAARFARGPITVSGGLAVGTRLLARHASLSHIHAYELVRGIVEPGVQEAFRRHIAPGAVVYDVGANIGFFSLLAARLTGPTGRVHAFEPVPESADAIRDHARLNGLENVQVHALAAGARAGEAVLLRVGEASWSHLADRGWHPDTSKQLSTQVTTLDALVDAGTVEPPDVVKIDVEGSEVDVLAGMAELLRAHAPIVICELHETNTEVLELLTTAGYEVENLDGPMPVADAGPVHVLGRPRQHPRKGAQ